MSNKHTPGPWYVSDLRWRSDAFGVLKIFSDATGFCVADVHVLTTRDGMDVDMAQTEANARLIAAAPEMRALLLQIHTELSHTASADADPANWEGYTLHRIEKLLWPENAGGNHETG